MQDMKVALFTIEDLKNNHPDYLLQTVKPEMPGLPEYFKQQ